MPNRKRTSGPEETSQWSATQDELLSLARLGGDPPSAKQGRLRTALRYYTLGGPGFNQAFDATIRAIAPDWFNALGKAITAKTPKQTPADTLLALAERGAPKPRPTSRLGDQLRALTTPSLLTYDRRLTIQIMALAPGWFSVRLVDDTTPKQDDTRVDGNRKPC